MRLEIVRAGGLAGLATRTELDAQSLDPRAAESFAEQVRDSGLLATRSAPEAGPASETTRHPDELLYEVKAEDRGSTCTHRYSEAQLPEQVRRLIAWVDQRPERDEAVEPLGGAPA
jgi:hypothetical protein